MSMATKPVLASDVAIAHLEGFTYPVESEENALFEKFFQDAKDVRVGGHLYVSPLIFHSATGTKNPCDHKLIDLYIYPYEVVRIETSEDNQRRINVHSAVTSKTRTKVSLEPSRSRNPRPFAEHVTQFFHDEVLNQPDPPVKGQTLIRIPVNAHSAANFPLSIDFSDSHWHDRLRSALTSYTEHCQALQSPESLTDIHCDLLRCILPYVEGTDLGVSSFSVLLDCAAEPSAIYNSEHILSGLSAKLQWQFRPIDARLFAVNKRRLEALPLHASLSSLATPVSIVQLAAQHGGCLVFLRDWDLVASYKPPQPADAPTQPSSSQQQQPTYAEALVDVVAEAVAQWRRDIDALLQQRRRNEASAAPSSPPAVVIVAASRHDTWLQQWRDPHSPLRRLFVTRCSPSAETLRNDAGSAPLPSAAPASAIGSASLWRFSSSASALLRCVNEQQQRPSTATSAVSHWWLTTPLAQAAQTIALERSTDWTALRDMLPLDDDLHDVVSEPSTTHQQQLRRVHWPRLLHGLPHAALVSPLAAENGTPLPPLRVTAHDVRRAFRQLFPHETLPQPPRALQLSATAATNAAAAAATSAAPSTRQTPTKAKTKTKKTANRIEAVHWADIGGLDRVRQEILDVLELPFHHPELFPPHAPRRQGVLLYGPPGTGKTLVAKAVATECQMSFLSVKGPELLDAYVGESEKNVRELFQRALRQAPCVLFFDEVDSLAPARAKRNDSGGGVTDRIVSQLLTELDQVLAAQQQQQQQSTPPPPPTPASSTDAATATSSSALPSSPSSPSASVFVIAATNRPDLLDPALLRPGRFDRKIYLGVCDDIDARHSILRAQTRKFPLADDVDLAAIASRAHLPGHVTGADLGAVSSAAYARALERRLAQLEEQRLQHRQQRSQRGHQLRHDEEAHGDDDEDVDNDDDDAAFLETLRDDEIEVRVTHDDFVDAARHLVPSVVDLSYYEALHRTYDSATPST